MLNPMAFLPDNLLEAEKVCTCGLVLGGGHAGCDCGVIFGSGAEAPKEATIESN